MIVAFVESKVAVHINYNIFHIDKTGCCISLSDAWKDISGFEINETLGSSFYNYFDDAIRNSNSNFRTSSFLHGKKSQTVGRANMTIGTKR